MRVDEWIIPAPAAVVAVAAVNAVLAQFGDDASVSTGYPFEDHRHVTIEVTGGDSPNLVTDRAGLAMQCWDFDEVGAEQLAGRVAAVMRRTPGGRFAGHFVRAWDLAARPYSFPDPDSRMSRYQITGSLSIRPSIQ